LPLAARAFFGIRYFSRIGLGVAVGPELICGGLLLPPVTVMVFADVTYLSRNFRGAAL